MKNVLVFELKELTQLELKEINGGTEIGYWIGYNTTLAVQYAGDGFSSAWGGLARTWDAVINIF